MLGRKEIVGGKVGKTLADSRDLREIEIWVAGVLVTQRDGIAHIPSLSGIAFSESEKVRDFARFNHYFHGKDEKEIHKFILDTRISDFDFKDSDEIYAEHQVFDWGTNTDYVMCFLVPYREKLFITISLDDEKESEIQSVEIDEDSLRELLFNFSIALSRS